MLSVDRNEASTQMFIYMRNTRGRTTSHTACTEGTETKEKGGGDEEVQGKSALIDLFVVIVGDMFEILFHNWRPFYLQTST